MPPKKKTASRDIKDRRRVNLGVGVDRRGTKDERRRCPQCGNELWQAVKKIPTGTRTVIACIKRGCGWSTKSNQIDSKVLTLKLKWDLPIEKMGASYVVEIPKPVMRALDLQGGDSLTLNPLTLPVGSLKMRWGVTANKKKKKGRKR